MTLRSTGWIVGGDEVAMSHRIALRLAPEDHGKPLIGIADTTSALNPCHEAFPELLQHVERGIRVAGGVPFRFPVMSLGEDLMKPSAMLYRNLVSMELEEMVRANPIDGLVCLVNCDKSVPAALMAAASTDVPSILVMGGARSAPLFRGRPLGSGTELWRALEDRRSGRLDDEQWDALEACLACAGGGSCNTMGTASTMSAVTEVLGMCLPGSTGQPAASAELTDVAYRSGEQIVRDVLDDVRPASRMTQAAFDNATAVLAAIGGSTNAVVHLAAIAGRLGLDAGLSRMDSIWRDIPLVANIEPAGSLLIHAFAAAGGVPAVVRSLGPLVDGSVVAADGVPWVEHAANACLGDVIRPADDPVAPAPAFAAVFGSLAPLGAVIKVAAATPELLNHTGHAVVFDSYDQMRGRLDEDDQSFAPGDVLVIRGCGPIGAPGMPEWGMAPIPAPLARKGVTDMVRISDGRMSGTSFGTVVLHVAPEAAIDGPIARVRTGDPVRLDVGARALDLLVDPATLAERVPLAADRHLRGWPKLYQDHVLQAPLGCDLDFLTAPSSEHRRFREPVIGRS